MVVNCFLKNLIGTLLKRSLVHLGASSLSYLTFSWQRSLSYRKQAIDLQSISMDWFLYDRDLRHERVNA